MAASVEDSGPSDETSDCRIRRHSYRSGAEPMTTSLTRTSHSMSLLDAEIVEESDLGSMRRITADNLPI